MGGLGWLEGEPATLEPPADLEQAALDLAGSSPLSRGADPSEGPLWGEHSAFRGGPLGRRDPCVRKALAALGEAIAGDAVAAAWEEALAAPEWNRPTAERGSRLRVSRGG